MPLALASQSHGRVAFGFFHIESDMLCLERLFFFAGDLCALWQRLAAWPPGADFQDSLEGFAINHPDKLGDLQGAIAGRDFSGFLGQLYRRWPFPSRPQDFAQKASGAASRQAMLEAIAPHAASQAIAVLARPGAMVFSLGQYDFSQAELLGLVDYVWRGGMPGWQKGQRPAYLLQTAQALAASASPWFAGQDWHPHRVGFGHLNPWRR